MYAESLENLIAVFKKMPGIGPKSAQRLAFYILSASDMEVKMITESMHTVKSSIKNCSTCFNITDNDPCKICQDASRDKSILCVVADPKDLIAIERTSEYKGLYHILGGVISPLDGVGPENLKIKELLARLKDGSVKEILLATNPTTEGEATVIYLTRLLKPLGVKITRLAYGLPIGSDMDYADHATLTQALEGRREVN